MNEKKKKKKKSKPGRLVGNAGCTVTSFWGLCEVSGDGERSPQLALPRARELWHGRKVSQGEHAGERGGREGVCVCWRVGTVVCDGGACERVGGWERVRSAPFQGRPGVLSPSAAGARCLLTTFAPFSPRVSPSDGGSQKLQSL